MNKIKILLVEDDMIIAADVSMQLQQLGYEVMDILSEGEEVLPLLEQGLPDIIIMDIHLKGQIDGVQTAQMVYDKYQLPIIFLTANSDEHTFNRAKATKPYAFIAKPFKRRDLIRAIELVISRLAASEQGEEALLKPSDQQIEEVPLPFILSDRIFVRHHHQMIKIYLKEILFVQAERNYCKIQTSQREYLMSIPLKRIEEKLPLEDFVRTHRSFLVNVEKIDTLSEHFDSLMIKNHKIPISRSLKNQVIRRLQMI